MNLPLFNTALLANSFWRAVSIDSIWHRIIADKYLGSLPLARWIRKPTFQLRWSSPFWKILISSIPIILHWLVWNPGDGTDIRIGADKVLGMGDRSLLTPELRYLLQQQNLYYLAQVKIQPGGRALPDIWLDSGLLQLSYQKALEWDHYTSALKEAGVSLTHGPDTLSWAGGDATGIITVKNLYNAIINQRYFILDGSWLFHIWHWEIPLKIKLFFWLTGKNKTLT